MCVCAHPRTRTPTHPHTSFPNVAGVPPPAREEKAGPHALRKASYQTVLIFVPLMGGRWRPGVALIYVYSPHCPAPSSTLHDFLTLDGGSEWED